MTSFESTVQIHPLQAPSSVLAWQAVVQVSPRQDLGMSPAGERFIIPIVGGQFAGDIDGHVLRGRVLPGGADRQLLRPDGIKELDALYEMQHDDGTVLTGQLAMPGGNGPFPAVLVMHNALGIGPHVREVTERLASLGYVAVATDMYGGGAPYGNPAAYEAFTNDAGLLRARVRAWFDHVAARRRHDHNFMTGCAMRGNEIDSFLVDHRVNNFVKGFGDD